MTSGFRCAPSPGHVPLELLDHAFEHAAAAVEPGHAERDEQAGGDQLVPVGTVGRRQ